MGVDGSGAYYGVIVLGLGVFMVVYSIWCLFWIVEDDLDDRLGFTLMAAPFILPVWFFSVYMHWLGSQMVKCHY